MQHYKVRTMASPVSVSVAPPQQTILGLDVHITNAVPGGIVIIELTSGMLSMDNVTAEAFLGHRVPTPGVEILLRALGDKISKMRMGMVDNGRLDLTTEMRMAFNTAKPVATARDVPASRVKRARVAGRVEMAHENMAQLVTDMATTITKMKADGFMVSDATIQKYGQRYASMRGEITQLRAAVTELEGAWETVQAQFLRMMDGSDE